MRRILAIVLLAGVAAGLLAACGGPAATTAAVPTTAATATTAPTATPAVSPAAKVVEEYLQGIVSKDVNKVSTLSCKDWEPNAIQLLDSFQAVDAKLDGVACTQSGTDGGNALVKCTGKIVITYNNENQELDLTARTFQVAQSGGDWLVCGEQ